MALGNVSLTAGSTYKGTNLLDGDADLNEEGANMLALQTQQQLSTSALSLSSQAAQAVLRLF